MRLVSANLEYSHEDPWNFVGANSKIKGSSFPEWCTKVRNKKDFGTDLPTCNNAPLLILSK